MLTPKKLSKKKSTGICTLIYTEHLVQGTQGLPDDAMCPNGQWGTGF
jgi:hypothetical protein